MRPSFILLTGALAAACSSTPEAYSLGGEPLYPPPLAPEVLEKREAQLAEAQARAREHPDDPDAMIWVGRRMGYLGEYVEAAQIFTLGIDRWPEDARFRRHRGHRRITLRAFGPAIDDLERAADLVADQPDRVEPDGLPNARNIPTSTLKFNIFYHLGLARYLSADFESAVEAWDRCLAVSKNPDTLCATTHWYYMTLRRLHRETEAERLLAPIHADLDVIENHGYHELCLMYRGERTPEEVMGSGEEGTVEDATVAYGVGNWYYYNGQLEKARAIFRRILENPQWAAFGYIAAEVEIHARGAASYEFGDGQSRAHSATGRR